MSKIHPQAKIDTFRSKSTHKDTEKFTIWMKSLVCQTNGLTIYDSKGKIVFRVENYEKKCSSEVHLMDLHGNVLFSVQEKKFRFSRCWHVYGSGHNPLSLEKQQPLVRVRRFGGIFKKSSSDYELRIGDESLWVLRLDPKATFQILDIHGDILAEAKAKQSTRGDSLGRDVLSLELKSCVDHSLAAAICAVYGLIKKRI